MSQLILLNKPYHVLSQFSDNDGRTTLAHFISQKGVYPAGRLDYDSEGLLLQGVVLKDGKTRPAIVEIITEPQLWQRTPPVRFRQSVPTHWLSITISEGKNRQIRRMTAAVNLPTLRLVRASIGSWSLNTLAPGEHQLIHVHMPTSPSSRKRRHTRTSNHRSSHPKTPNKLQPK